MITLIMRIKSHNWDAEPDNFQAMEDLKDILQLLKKIPLTQLAAILRDLPLEISNNILQLLSEGKIK